MVAGSARNEAISALVEVDVEADLYERVKS